MEAERVRRLKDLVDQLERLPASEDRDRVLSEVRSRAVDLDTGVTPRAMLPMREPVDAPVAPRVARRVVAEPAPRREPPIRVAQVVAPPPVRPVETVVLHDDWLSAGELLSLDDAPLPDVTTRDGQAVPPWTLGLRG